MLLRCVDWRIVLIIRVFIIFVISWARLLLRFFFWFILFWLDKFRFRFFLRFFFRFHHYWLRFFFWFFFRLIRTIRIDDVLHRMGFSINSFLFLSWYPIYCCFSIRLINFSNFLLIPCSQFESTQVMFLNFGIWMYSNGFEVYQNIMICRSKKLLAE